MEMRPADVGGRASPARREITCSPPTNGMDPGYSSTTSPAGPGARCRRNLLRQSAFGLVSGRLTGVQEEFISSVVRQPSALSRKTSLPEEEAVNRQAAPPIVNRRPSIVPTSTLPQWTAPPRSSHRQSSADPRPNTTPSSKPPAPPKTNNQQLITNKKTPTATR